MITTGLPHGSKTEIVDVVSGETCVDLDDSPLYNRGAVGANLYGSPVICGGAYVTYFENCYKFINGGWQKFASMNNKRWLAAGVMYKKSFHVFGGSPDNLETSLQTSEIISIDGGVEYGPDLPTGVFGHAITSINATMSILTGGQTSVHYFSPLTWYFNHETKSFSSGPSLLVGRHGHSSATVVDKVTSAKIPIIAGGGNGVALNSTELLINGQWQSGTAK